MSADLIDIINFNLGQVKATRGVIEAWESIGLDPKREGFELIARHWNGDWGELDDDDRAINDQALKDGGRVLSRYDFVRPGFDIYIITEADRTITTILLVNEY